MMLRRRRERASSVFLSKERGNEEDGDGHDQAEERGRAKTTDGTGIVVNHKELDA